MAASENDDQARLTTLQKLSRRAFLSRAGAAGVATATAGIAAPAAAAVAQQQSMMATSDTATPPTGTIPITLKVNGKVHRVQIDPRATVLDTLRETLQLTGTKKGCDHGQCGACTVHVNGLRANSCLLFAAMQQNAEITTIEGLGTPERDASGTGGVCRTRRLPVRLLHQRADHVCGCHAQEPWGPADEDVKEA